MIQADSSDAQEHRLRGDIRDATEPAERRLPGQNRAGTTLKGPCRYIAFGFCMTGRDGVDAHLARGQFGHARARSSEPRDQLYPALASGNVDLVVALVTGRMEGSS